MSELLKRLLLWAFAHRQDIAREVKEVVDPAPAGTPWPYKTTEHVRKQIDAGARKFPTS